MSDEYMENLIKELDETNKMYVISSNASTFSISIDKEHFRKKFEKVIEEWKWHAYVSFKDEEDLLNRLMKCFDEEK